MAHHRNMVQLPDGYERWICVYPAYINRDRTIAEGRRIPQEKAVSAPLFEEIIDVLCATGLTVLGERKVYCREKCLEKQNLGRIRVQIKSDNGTFMNPKFQSRKDVFLYVAEKIPQLKSRTNPRPTPEPQAQKAGKSKKKK